MIFIEKIQHYIDQLEQQTFYYYAGGLIGIMLLSTLGMMYYNYSSVSALQTSIEEINEEREDTVRKLLSKAESIQKEQKEISQMLAQTEDFKIGGYFEGVRTKLGLQPSLEATAQADREDNYRESSLKAKFEAITMKQLLELLQELEKNERIYTKEVEIKKAKTPRAIDVDLTIGTLQPKTIAPE